MCQAVLSDGTKREGATREGPADGSRSVSHAARAAPPREQTLGQKSSRRRSSHTGRSLSAPSIDKPEIITESTAFDNRTGPGFEAPFSRFVASGPPPVVSAGQSVAGPDPTLDFSHQTPLVEPGRFLGS